MPILKRAQKLVGKRIVYNEMDPIFTADFFEVLAVEFISQEDYFLNKFLFKEFNKKSGKIMVFRVVAYTEGEEPFFQMHDGKPVYIKVTNRCRYKVVE